MYNWEKSKSKSKSNSKHKYHNDQYDPKTPTLSSSFLNKFNKPLKTHPSKTSQILVSDGLIPVPSKDRGSSTTKNRTPKTPTTTTIEDDEKMSSLRRACLVEKWMDKKVSEKVITQRVDKKSSSRSSSSTTLLEEFDLQDALFFSSTTTTTTSTSTSPSETEYSECSHKTKQKQPKAIPCFAPSRPKPIKTHHSIESKYLQQFDNNKNSDMKEDRTRSTSTSTNTTPTTASRAAQFYSNLKNLKQPISPGVKLTSFINALFAKEGNKNKTTRKKINHNIVTKQQSNYHHPSTNNNKDETSSYSYTCSSASSFSRSCLMSKSKRLHDAGVKRTVRFCPVSVIVDDESQPCGYKSLREEKGDRLLNSRFEQSLSKSYQELKRFNELEKECDKLQQQKKLEEVALDLLSGYWDNRLSKSHDLSCKEKVNDDNYVANHGINYVANHGVNYVDEEEDDDDDGFSCSSSDLFELDHLSLIGNELPVYETTQI